MQLDENILSKDEYAKAELSPSPPRFAQRSGDSYFGDACRAAWYSGFL